MSTRKNSKNVMPYREWTNREHETLLRMRQEGAPVREIATTVGRSYNAVIGRIQQYNLYARVSERQSLPPLRMTVEKSQVPDLYERGWRFAGFDGDKCVFELRAA
jgi:hypothetical protein